MSKKKKGLSADEKRSVILDIYHTEKVPFNLKEIETLASKKGVVLQTIKEQNQSLVDDFLVQSDKLGASNFFWSFPSAAFMERKSKVSQLESLIAQQESRLNENELKVATLTKDRSCSGRKQKV